MRPLADTASSAFGALGDIPGPARQQAMRAFTVLAPAFALPLAVLLAVCISLPAAIVVGCSAVLHLAPWWLAGHPVAARRIGLTGLWVSCLTLACLIDGPVSVTGLQWCALVPAVAVGLGGPRSGLRWAAVVTAGALLLGQAGDGLQTLLQQGAPAPAWFIGMLQGVFVAAMGAFTLACQRGTAAARSPPPDR